MYDFAVTVLSLGLLLTLWVLFQAWVRRHTPGMRRDADVLSGRIGSCGACFGFEDCRLPNLVTHPDIVEIDPVDEVSL